MTLADTVIITMGTERFPATLADFLAHNADGLGENEVDDILAALAERQVYEGGGGAAPSFTLQRLEA